MTTPNELYEALIDGRWQPEIQLDEKNNKYVASYKQGEKTISKESEYSAFQAQTDLINELKRGTLEGEYFPES